MKPPEVGSLTDRVSFQRRETTGEDEGGQIALFVPVTSLWARVRALSGRQVTEADRAGWRCRTRLSCGSAPT